MPAKIQQSLNMTSLATADSKELARICQSLLVDINALRTAFNVVTAKLDADATVTDTNYAALSATTATTTL